MKIKVSFLVLAVLFVGCSSPQRLVEQKRFDEALI